MTIYKGFTELIGKTPLVEVTSIERGKGFGAGGHGSGEAGIL